MENTFNIKANKIFSILVIFILFLFNKQTMAQDQGLDVDYSHNYICIADELKLNNLSATRQNKDIDFDGENDYYQSKVYHNNKLSVNLIEIFESNYYLEFKNNKANLDDIWFDKQTNKMNNVFSSNKHNLEIIAKENKNLLLILSQQDKYINFVCNQDVNNKYAKANSKSLLKKIFN